MTLYWYVNSLGRLCIGKNSPLTNSRFNIETNFKPTHPIQAPVTQKHIETIGSYPEDWPHDAFIAEKISAAARIIFDDLPATADSEELKQYLDTVRSVVA
jgi:hypothetical protein